MCGLAGQLNLNGSPIDQTNLVSMGTSLSHRGPDGLASWLEGPVGCVHARLAVIELSESGSQPMLSEDQRYVLCYNGMIYNFSELRVRLKTLGYKFRGCSDTEVVLYSLIEWGKAALNLFNGMFALSFWDRKEKKLLLCRDRYGIKPLYYYNSGDVFLYASEQKAFLNIENFKKAIDVEAIFEYFTFQNLLSERTFFKDVKLLPPGSALLFTFDGKFSSISIEKYWDFEFEEPAHKFDKREYEEELLRVMRVSVERQLVSDVPIGSYLSGGLDSAAICSVASQNLTHLKTFTCGFDIGSASGIELGFDERKQAELISKIIGTSQYEFVLKSGDLFRCLDKLVWHLEEPRIGQCYPNYYIAELASKFVKVVFSGAGSDELFAGYPWRYPKVAGNVNFESFAESYYGGWQRLVPNRTLKKLFSPKKAEIDDVKTIDIFKNVIEKYKGKQINQIDQVNCALHFEAKTFLHSLFLVEDKISMAHGLETRVPFMDNDLVNFAQKCPLSLKLGRFTTGAAFDENDFGRKTDVFHAKYPRGKTLLRSVLSEFLPKEIIQAKKQGFSSPDASWFRSESLNELKTKIDKKDSRVFEFLDWQTVRNITDSHFSGESNKRLFIWSFLYFEKWLDTFGD